MQLGAVRVFVTLGYVAIQVGHAKREIQRSISQSRAESVRELALSRSSNECLRKAYIKVDNALRGEPTPFELAAMSRAGLSREEANALNLEQTAWWYFRAQGIHYIDQFTPGERAEVESALRRLYGKSHGPYRVERLWYETMKGSQNPVAVRFIDDLLARINTSDV